MVDALAYIFALDALVSN